MHRLFLIMAGRHQLGSNLISTSYHQCRIPITPQWSSQEGNGELQVQFSPPLFEDIPGKSHVGRHVGRMLRSKRERSFRWAGSQEHRASALQGCRQTQLPVLISCPSSSLSTKFQAGLQLWLTFKTVTSLQTLTWRPLSSLTLKCYHRESAQLDSAS